MWNFFKKKTGPPFVNVELLSVHLPKTGGQSFIKTLENIYGNKLLKVYSPARIKSINENSLDSLPSAIRALHGHVELNDASRRLFPHAKIVCWLRHPVERAISHYHYWLTYPEHGNPVHSLFLQEKPSMEEFLSKEVYRRTSHAIQSFLNDFPLEEIYFIGRLEHYKEDLLLLASLMNWPSHKLHFQVENKNAEKSPVSAKTRAKLEMLLANEIECYHRLTS